MIVYTVEYIHLNCPHDDIQFCSLFNLLYHADVVLYYKNTSFKVLGNLQGASLAYWWRHRPTGGVTGLLVVPLAYWWRY